jgi:hypothetical protein
MAYASATAPEKAEAKAKASMAAHEQQAKQQQAYNELVNGKKKAPVKHEVPPSLPRVEDPVDDPVEDKPRKVETVDRVVDDYMSKAGEDVYKRYLSVPTAKNTLGQGFGAPSGLNSPEDSATASGDDSADKEIAPVADEETSTGSA